MLFAVLTEYFVFNVEYSTVFIILIQYNVSDVDIVSITDKTRMCHGFVTRARTSGKA